MVRYNCTHGNVGTVHLFDKFRAGSEYGQKFWIRIPISGENVKNNYRYGTVLYILQLSATLCSVGCLWADHVFSKQYDYKTVDDTWRCVFCHQKSHYKVGQFFNPFIPLMGKTGPVFTIISLSVSDPYSVEFGSGSGSRRKTPESGSGS